MSVFAIAVAVVLLGGMVAYALFSSGAGRELVQSWSAGRVEAQARRTDPGPAKISEVGTAVEGAGLACPVCGGSQFKPARKLSTKLSFGAASLLGQAKHVVCVTCGTRYRRG